MSGSRSETTADTVCGRWEVREPTDGCACCTCDWAFGWLMTPLFRASARDGRVGARGRERGGAGPVRSGPVGALWGR